MKFWSLVALIVLLFTLSGNKLCSGYSGGLDKQEATRLAELRSEGLNGDRSQINALLIIVRKPFATNPKSFGPSIDELLVVTALRALTRLQVTEAIPDITALITQTQAKYPDLANFAIVQRAHLQADASMTGSVGKTPESIEAFIKALGLTPAGINAGAGLYKKQFYADANGRYLPRPVEVYALREIADIIYHGSYQEAAALPDVSTLDFSLDPPAALKMRLAPFSPGERASRLVGKITAGQASPEV